MFKKATKKQQKLRLLLEGAAGSGKTYSALTLARAFGDKVAFIDTEFGSASLYSDRFDFDVMELLPPFTPEKYIEAIQAAEKANYDVLIIDSVTHEWSGQGGCLDIQTALGGRFNDWGKVTPRHKKFIDTILNSKLHIIACARTKSEYAVERNDKGKTEVAKLGTKTEQREGLDYEFTCVLRINQNHMASSAKDRTGLFDGVDAILRREHGETLIKWLNSGEVAEHCTHGETIDDEKTLTPRQLIINLCKENNFPMKQIPEVIQTYFKKDKVTDLTYDEQVEFITNFKKYVGILGDESEEVA